MSSATKGLKYIITGVSVVVFGGIVAAIYFSTHTSASTDTLKNQTQALRADVDTLKSQNQVQDQTIEDVTGPKLSAIRADVDTLKSQNQTQDQTIEGVVGPKLSALLADVDTLKNRTDVIFAAESYGPFPTIQTENVEKIKMRWENFNVGNAYNHDTSTFTAPRDGIYFFYVNVFIDNRREITTVIRSYEFSINLIKNDDSKYNDATDLLYVVTNESSPDFDLRYGSRTMNLKQGDRIYLRGRLMKIMTWDPTSSSWIVSEGPNPRIQRVSITWGGHLLS